MTCREKLKLEYPDRVDKNYVGGCDGCPRDYGYMASPDYCNGYDDEVCTKCWDREVSTADFTPIVKGAWRRIG